MPILSKPNMFFQTDMYDLDLEASGGWTPDCNGKQDYDPAVIRISSRVWRDGDYTLSVMVGDEIIYDTNILQADSVAEAKLAVERHAEDIAARVVIAAKTALAGYPA